MTPRFWPEQLRWGHELRAALGRNGVVSFGPCGRCDASQRAESGHERALEERRRAGLKLHTRELSVQRQCLKLQDG